MRPDELPRIAHDPAIFEAFYATRLLEDAPGGAGYLLKERVSDLAVLADGLRRIDEGECVIDPAIVTQHLALAVGQLIERVLAVLTFLRST